MVAIDGPGQKKSNANRPHRHEFRPTHGPKRGQLMVLLTHGSPLLRAPADIRRALLFQLVNEELMLGRR